MQLTIGSQRLRNTDGIITVSGSRQICLEWGPVDSELLLTMNLYGSGGTHIARLRRNQWTFNDRDRFEFATTARGLNLVDTKLRRVVLDARILGADSVVITQGEFYSSTGHQVELTKVDWSAELEPRTPADPALELVKPRFSEDEITSIREAVESSNETLQCPSCGCPLSRERSGSGTNSDAVTVTCIMCRRNLVVEPNS